ncbi:MAG: PhoH family protein [FCB group bacterium]|nr:PhoH family protein [FCB group bacterium]MBL7027039.1 PhoH family protein [Candidatus Neomarinimicrobiota bacterium]MBL7122219.1 PhoH family protein [Candidatus Neomarinimicrobiota bacterium]
MGLTTAKSAAEKRLPIREVSPVELLGANDTNLKLIENHLEVALYVRGDELIVRGDESKLALVENIIGEMIAVLNRKKFIDKDDVLTIIRLSQSGKSTLGEAGLDSVVLFTRSEVIKPRTPGQERYFSAATAHDMVFGLGPAGTGKTYMAVAFAISALKNREVKKIILTRPAVEAGERLGFLPGDLREKVDPYLAPLYDALFDMMPHDKVRILMDQKTIEIVPLAYMRGRTLDHAFIILDEAQNTTPMQMKMFLTRMGVNSKIIITGDPTQIDLPKHEESGLLQAVRILKEVDGIAFVEFDEGDIVRHKLVRRIIKAYDQPKES